MLLCQCLLACCHLVAARAAAAAAASAASLCLHNDVADLLPIPTKLLLRSAAVECKQTLLAEYCGRGVAISFCAVFVTHALHANSAAAAAAAMFLNERMQSTAGVVRPSASAQ
jgi:hypothetical protein